MSHSQATLPDGLPAALRRSPLSASSSEGIRLTWRATVGATTDYGPQVLLKQLTMQIVALVV